VVGGAHGQHGGIATGSDDLLADLVEEPGARLLAERGHLQVLCERNGITLDILHMREARGIAVGRQTGMSGRQGIGGHGGGAEGGGAFCIRITL